MCTVKLSRTLYPHHDGHGLDAIMARHGLACSARHRAMGDVELVVDDENSPSGIWARPRFWRP